MSELAKWVWLILLIVLFAGPWTLIIIGLDLLMILLVWLFKPEWMNKFF